MVFGILRSIKVYSCVLVIPIFAYIKNPASCPDRNMRFMKSKLINQAWIFLPQDPKNHWLLTRISFDLDKLLFWNASIWVRWPCRLKSWATVIGFGFFLRMGKFKKNTFWDYPTFAWSCIITASKIRTSSLCFSIRTTSMFLFEKNKKYN